MYHEWVLKYISSSKAKLGPTFREICDINVVTRKIFSFDDVIMGQPKTPFH